MVNSFFKNENILLPQIFIVLLPKVSQVIGQGIRYPVKLSVSSYPSSSGWHKQKVTVLFCRHDSLFLQFSFSLFSKKRRQALSATSALYWYFLMAGSLVSKSVQPYLVAVCNVPARRDSRASACLHEVLDSLRPIKQFCILSLCLASCPVAERRFGSRAEARAHLSVQRQCLKSAWPALILTTYLNIIRFRLRQVNLPSAQVIM